MSAGELRMFIWALINIYGLRMGWGTRRTNAGQEKENETGGGNCFQRSFEKEEKLIVMRAERRQFRNFLKAG